MSKSFSYQVFLLHGGEPASNMFAVAGPSWEGWNYLYKQVLNQPLSISMAAIQNHDAMYTPAKGSLSL